MRHGDLKVWTEDWDGTPVVAAAGEIDLSTVEQFRAVTSEAVRKAPVQLIFDLRQVTFIDSSGLGILVAARKRLSNTQEAVVVVANQPAVLNSLSITGLDRIFTVQREACAATSKP